MSEPLEAHQIDLVALMLFPEIGHHSALGRSTLKMLADRSGQLGSGSAKILAVVIVCSVIAWFVVDHHINPIIQSKVMNKQA